MLQSIAPKDKTGLAASDLLDVGCIALTALAAVALATNEHNFARSVAAFIFVLFIPGRAIVSNWPEMPGRSVVAVSILFSLALNTLIATVALWAHVWHPAGNYRGGVRACDSGPHRWDLASACHGRGTDAGSTRDRPSSMTSLPTATTRRQWRDCSARQFEWGSPLLWEFNRIPVTV